MNTQPLPPTQNPEERDLGFGSYVARESRRRLLNRDGSFNVARSGLNPWSSFYFFHTMLTITWGKFFGIVVFAFFASNALFACAYLLAGPGSLMVPEGLDAGGPFWQAFFFSIHTMGTIGYGNITPVGLTANFIVAVEALFGLLAFALVTGLFFARFSRPTAKILFSDCALIAPYRGMTAFEFRITNGRRNQIIELQATVMLSIFVEENGRRLRRFFPLSLEREKVTFFSLSWTIVHPIDQNSPLHGMTDADLRERDAEFLILLTGIDETFSQTVHTRSSYLADEVVWHARFTDIYNPPSPSGRLTIDIRKLNSIEK